MKSPEKISLFAARIAITHKVIVKRKSKQAGEHAFEDPFGFFELYHVSAGFARGVSAVFSREALIQSQERSARDFVPDRGLEIAGILGVFQGLQTDKLGQKTRRAPLPIDSEVPS